MAGFSLHCCAMSSGRCGFYLENFEGTLTALTRSHAALKYCTGICGLASRGCSLITPTGVVSARGTAPLAMDLSDIFIM